MKTLRFKTNINCSNCKEKVSNFLNNEPTIQKWDVDVDNPEKILIVEGEKVTDEIVISTIAKAGFKAVKI